MSQRQGQSHPHESISISLKEMKAQIQRGMNPEFHLHKAAYLGDVHNVREILNQDDQSGESIVRKRDKAGMTALHNAASGGSFKSTEICELLLGHDTTTVYAVEVGTERLVNMQDDKRKTALHYAAVSNQLDLVTLLLDKEADPNIQDMEQCTPLHICCRGNSEAAVKCADFILHSPSFHDAEPYNRYISSILHIAANAKAHIMVEFLLREGFDHSRKDSRGFTPLHLAIGAGDSPEAVKCVQALLKVSNVEEVNVKSKESGQTALHIAAFKCHKHILTILLEGTTANIWAIDNQKRTALHWATEAWFRTDSYECVKLLVESSKISEWHHKGRFLYKQKDSNDETALDIAIKHRSIMIAEYLIQAHPSPDAWLEDSVLGKIYETIPEAMIPLLNNYCITYTPSTFHQSSEAVDIDFGPITGFKDPVEGYKRDVENEEPTADDPIEDDRWTVKVPEASDEDPVQYGKMQRKVIQQESKYLHNILHSSKEVKRRIFHSPVVQIFIESKWKKIRLVACLEVAFKFVWLFLYTTLVFELYKSDCPNETASLNCTTLVDGPNGLNRNETTIPKFLLSLTFQKSDATCSFVTSWAFEFAIALYSMSIVIMAKEIFQMTNSEHFQYMKNMWNWLQWVLLIVFVVNSYPAFQTEPEILEWQTYISALGIFLAWILMLREIGKFPSCAIYTAIFKKMFWRCLQLFGIFISVQIAFGTCLMILLPEQGQYTNVWLAFFKVTIMMMAGEVDFENTFYKDGVPNLGLNSIIGQIVIIVLVFVTLIVILNLVTGLAVHDVESQLEEAEVIRLSNQLEQIYVIESLVLLIRRIIGEDTFTRCLHKLNVTSTFYEDGFCCFTSKISGVETKSYPPDLKRRVKECMVPAICHNRS